MHNRLLLDGGRLHDEIRRRGYASVQVFADTVGVHRNTVGNYLSGRVALPGALARILSALDLQPADVLRLERPTRRVPGLAVAGLVSTLSAELSDAAIVLFGSRARDDAKPYSDYDLGVAGVAGVPFDVYSGMLDHVAAWNEVALHTAQLVDLNRADDAFLHQIAGELVLLGGSLAAWCALLERAGERLHE